MRTSSQAIVLGLSALVTPATIGTLFAQACVQSPAGLIGWWPGDGNANDVIGGNHGTLQNGATFDSGKVGQAFRFDGQDDQVSGNTVSGFALGSSPRTITAWIKSTTTFTGDRNIFHYGISNPNVPPTNYHLFIRGATGRIGIGNGYNLGTVDGNTVVDDGNFHLVAGVYEGTETNIAHVYVDGVLDASGVIAPPGTVLGTWRIGRFMDPSPEPGFQGLIDEVDLYNRALSASEIQAIYLAGSAGKCKPAGPDTVGPVSSKVTINSNPVAVNTGSTLIATVDDSTTGGSNVASAYYSVDGGFSLQMMLSPVSAVVAQASASLAPFSTSNVYRICVRGTDSAGYTGEPACSLLPVYDPTGGFITGGGQVWSGAGADLLNAGAAGTVTFGFVSKYLPGTSRPSGNLEFQFKEGNLNFKSSSMDWLVVTGQPRAIFRGTGTVNGTNMCKFEVDAWDGSFAGNADAFGLKITSCAVGGDRYSLPAAPLTKGSIIIHR